MLTVHHLQRSQSERIPWLCEELGIPYTLKLYKRDPILCPPELAAMTPLKAAPVIEDSTFEAAKPLVLAESAAIVEYIIHKHGNGKLALPPSHKDYADYLYWFHVSNGSIQPTIKAAMVVMRLQLSHDHPTQKDVSMRLKRVLDMVNERLLKVPWLAGEEFTAADIMTVYSLSTYRIVFPIDLTEYEGIVAWLKRVGERPAYQRAMAKGDPGFTPALSAKTPEPFAPFKN